MVLFFCAFSSWNRCFFTLECLGMHGIDLLLLYMNYHSVVFLYIWCSKFLATKWYILFPLWKKNSGRTCFGHVIEKQKKYCLKLDIQIAYSYHSVPCGQLICYQQRTLCWRQNSSCIGDKHGPWYVPDWSCLSIQQLANVFSNDPITAAFSEYQSAMVQREAIEVRKLHPREVIIYAVKYCTHFYHRWTKVWFLFVSFVCRTCS